jgi:hypothetical protein
MYEEDPGFVFGLQITRASGIPVVRQNAKENQKPPRGSPGASGRAKGWQGAHVEADGRGEKRSGP